MGDPQAAASSVHFHDDRPWSDPKPGSEAWEVDLGRIQVRGRLHRRSPSEGSSPGFASIGGRPRRDPGRGLMHRRSTSNGSRSGVSCIGGRPRRDPSPASQASEVNLGGIHVRVSCIGGRPRRDPSPGSEALVLASYCCGDVARSRGRCVRRGLVRSPAVGTPPLRQLVTVGQRPAHQAPSEVRADEGVVGVRLRCTLAAADTIWTLRHGDSLLGSRSQ
jgi:hypothetical protein